MKYSIWYAIIVGVLLVILWGVMILGNTVPEFVSEPWAIAHHITAEMGMAATLLIGGLGALRNKHWAPTWLLVGLGMVIYSAINSSGYYSQQGQWGVVFMFLVVLGAAVWAVRNLLPKPAKHRHHRRR
jgi:hypothetical protein